MNPFEYLSDRLTGEMHEGNMHAALRDIGRLAGGLLVAGDLTEPDVNALGEHAESLAINRREAATKWLEAVEFGRTSPVKWDTLPRRADKVLDWGDEIGSNYQVVDAAWLEPVEVVEPDSWDPVAQVSDYLVTLFSSEEYVGYVTESFEKDGRRLPSRGNYSRTSGELLAELARYKDIGSVFGDVDPAVGAWIRFNPLDGQGVKDSNVTDFRFALVESDSMPIDQQRAVYEELELPIAVMVHSGNKSLHAIVRIDAGDRAEYKRRVELLYQVCEKNGLTIDTQNKNPSRLSRMPGVIRGDQKQFIVARNVGKGTWTEWEDWIEAVNDSLPDPESLAAEWDRLPPLSPPLIDGVLRQGHKMLVSGPSKAGKSFLLIDLCIAIAEGRRWLGWDCTQGRVLYVNLELDRASCLHRFRDVYEAMQLPASNLANIDIWNLRGQAVPMDKLAPKLIRRALKKRYTAVVIDPIYKVITGDENAADKMAFFCNQFDKVCHELQAAVIYCHHHSKGSQGGKRSMDRASGSGVFARDPDALLDLIELTVSDELRREIERSAVCGLIAADLDSYVSGWREFAADDEMFSEIKMMELGRRLLGDSFDKANQIFQARQRVALQSAWRIEGTFREYPRAAPTNLWFDYPLHLVDEVGVLKDVLPVGEESPWQKAGKASKESAVRKEESQELKMRSAYMVLKSDGPVTVKAMADYFSKEGKTVRNWIKKYKQWWNVEDGIVTFTPEVEKETTDGF
jgi:hypothetical protein